jgi:hypothetical protein
MVIPYWLWARKELAKESITDVDRATIAVAAAGVPWHWVFTHWRTSP